MAQLQVDHEKKFWHSFYDYIVKRCNDLGTTTLYKYMPEEKMRTLSRREQTSKDLWHTLPPSAEDSDDSTTRLEFEHPILKAKQKFRNQKHLMIKKNPKDRKDSEQVNINGKVQMWGLFVKQFKEDLSLKQKRGEEISAQQFFLNYGDPHKEKILSWNPSVGFLSENSEDEKCHYDRSIRFFMRY